MKNFSELSLTQQKCVMAYLKSDPTLKDNPEMSLKQVHEMHNALNAKRGDGAPFVGFPNWLFNLNKIKRGVYLLPIPSDSDVTKFNQDLSAPKKKVIKASAETTAMKDDAEIERSRLQQIIDDVDPIDDTSAEDAEFIRELRENGINV